MRAPRQSFAVLLVALMTPVVDAASWSAGMQTLQLIDPVDDQPMQALAFYPSSAPPTQMHLGDYQIDAGAQLPIAAGRFPLLVMSHGNTGSPLALHDLATSLARQGFVVVAVTHPGDNTQDHSRLGALSNLYGRPLQVSAAISAARADPRLGLALNRGKVGVIGYSAGGETALILAGAEPDPTRLRQHCLEFPGDADACHAHGVLRADYDELGPAADRRVGAVMLLAPLSLLFGRQALSAVHVPALIYSGDNDQLLMLARNAQALARKLPQAPDYRLLAGAGHFVFMAPCDAQQLQRMPALCKDADGVDRENIHQTLQSEAGAFFGQALTLPHLQRVSDRH
ncbi:dienelactone hydrolase [Pseudomonas sp.]|uniref:alpha/beta hydrolase family protein n=1 Tax=Pseudomonas sp. TaxID=306 RepID=UPI0028A7B4A6|nr:dienelactone hydrolase [Pseudomonas sp.]